jgi:hypothetical protein
MLLPLTLEVSKPVDRHLLGLYYGTHCQHTGAYRTQAGAE